MFAYKESVKLTRFLFHTIYGTNPKTRKNFDKLVIDFIRLYKMSDMEYTYTSLYYEDKFTFHISVLDKSGNSVSIITFIFHMIWNESQFNNDLLSICTNVGTPAYWFGSKENRPVKDEITYTI